MADMFMIPSMNGVLAVFFDNLKYRKVSLFNTKDIVKYCFIVQNSLSYLNLELSRDCVFHDYRAPSHHSGLQYVDGFVNTEEKCRTRFDSDRLLMYTLHLDVPKGRNTCLKNVPKGKKLLDSKTLPLGKLSVSKRYYPSILSTFIEHIFKHQDDTHKLRVTKWLFRLDAARELEFGVLSAKITNYFIDFLYPTYLRSKLMRQFLRKCNLAIWVKEYEKPEVLEDLLYYALRCGRRRIGNHCIHDHALLNLCFYKESFLNIGPLLKYRYSPAICSYVYELCMREVLYYVSYLEIPDEVFIRPQRYIHKRRHFLLMQIVLCYFSCKLFYCEHTSDPPKPHASEALRLLWSAYSDPFLSLNEIKTAFEGAVGPEMISDIFEFYAQSVGETHVAVSPRTLKHHCRTTVRKIMWQRKKWIPEGVAKIGLPKQLQAFLNLEKLPVLSVK